MFEDISKKQITIDQHYLPRLYMKSFGNVVGKGKKEKVLTSFYQFKGKLLKEDIPTKSICFKEYFYGMDGKIEQDFAQRETRWVATISHIINADSYDLNTRQEKNIKEFAVYQHMRTVATHNFSKRAMEEMLTSFVIMNHPNANENDIQELVQNKIDDEITPAIIIESCEEVLSSLSDLKISIIRFGTSHKLITSDMPIIITNPAFPYEAGLSNAGIFLIFPLSPNTALAIFDGTLYSNCEQYIIINNEEDIKNLNKYQILSAEERIIAKNKQELEMAILDADILERKVNFDKKKKTHSCYGEKGLLFTVRSRNIPYEFALSFCKLPKLLRKISLDCRRTIPRIYSYKVWVSLLVAAYRAPDFLKTNSQISMIEAEIKNRKDNSLKMLRFAEDYWKMPMRDRIISPELMKKIKTVPLKHFPLN